MKAKTHKSKAKRIARTKSGLVSRARVNHQHIRSRKSKRQLRAAKTRTTSIHKTDKKLMLS